MTDMDNIVEVDLEDAVPRPTKAEWEWHKAEIIALYAVHTLDEVRESMWARYKFYGTKRMYHSRLRQWDIHKYMNAAQKESLAARLSHGVRSGDSITVNWNDLKKLMRYVNNQEKMARQLSLETRQDQVQPKQEDSTSEPAFTTVDDLDFEWLDIGSGAVNLDQSSLQGTTVSSSPSHSPISASRKSSFDSLDVQLGNLAPTPALTLDKANQTLEQILHVVKSYYLAKFDEWPEVPGNDSILKMGTTLESRLFWSNLKNGIYLWKIKSQFPDEYNRAFSAFSDANGLAETALSTDPVDFCLELLATLSPWNTSIYPPLRKHLLTHIRQTAAASNRLGPAHPITQLCDALLEDEDNAAISLTALFSVYGIFGERLGYESAGSEKIATTLVKSLRRAGPQHLEHARAFGEQRLSMTRFLEGDRSDEARRTAVELAHILTKVGDHGRALSLRLAVVRPMVTIHGTPLDLEGDDAWQTDEIAIHAMEDIAEHYVRFGDQQEAGFWLAQAEMHGRQLWGDCVAVGHITDKMQKLALGVVKGQVADE